MVEGGCCSLQVKDYNNYGGLSHQEVRMNDDGLLEGILLIAKSTSLQYSQQFLLTMPQEHGVLPK